MAKYKTADGEKVDVKEVVGEPNEFGETVSIFEVTYPGGETREVHESVFSDNFKKV